MAVCCKCNEAVAEKIISALGRTYHPQHFTCIECEQPIEASKFNVVKNEPVCGTCYRKRHASRCHACGLLILERPIAAVGRKWHENCFRCMSCGTSLLATTFYEANGYLFCKSDFRDAFSARCAHCDEPIANSAVVALNTKWHSDCFRCFVCKDLICGDKFSIFCGRPVCTQCSRA